MSKRKKLGREVAIVGAGMSQFGLFPEKDSKDLFLEAFLEMRDSVDKGVDLKEIEALYLGNFTNDFFTHQAHWGPIIADTIGLSPRPATRTEGACASSALAFREGVFAIASGMYDMVLVGGVEQMSACTTEQVAEGLSLGTMPYEAQTGFTFPGIFGAVATAYFAAFGASREQLMGVTIKSHNNAPLNPKGQIRQTVRDLMNKKTASIKRKNMPVPEWNDERDFLRDPQANPMVAWPMHLFDCCPISDGGSCLLLTTAERASQFTDKPLYVAGIGQGSGRGFHASPEITSFEATKYAAQEAYGMAGMSSQDIQFAEVHDCFSIAEIIHTEDLGFFAPGQGGHAANDKLTTRDGAIPINTSGGLKCKGHPVGATGTSQMVELWKQLRREAGERQIPQPGLERGLAHNLGGTGGTCTVTILERR